MRERYDIPRNVLDRLAEIGVLTPNRNGYEQDDVKIIEAIASFRAGGYEEALGFTVYDTLRYREALEPLVQEEVRALLERLAGEVDVERAMEIVAAGVEPLRELLGAMHSKLLLAELRRQRARATERGRAEPPPLPERAVMLDHAEPVSERDASRQRLPRKPRKGLDSHF